MWVLHILGSFVYACYPLGRHAHPGVAEEPSRMNEVNTSSDAAEDMLVNMARTDTADH